MKIPASLGIIVPKICPQILYFQDMKEYPNLALAIGQVIEILRQNRKMTKSSLAEFSWLERRYLREIELGIKKPTVNAIYSICEALNESPIDFFIKVEKERKKLEEEQSLNIYKV